MELKRRMESDCNHTLILANPSAEIKDRVESFKLSMSMIDNVVHLLDEEETLGRVDLGFLLQFFQYAYVIGNIDSEVLSQCIGRQIYENDKHPDGFSLSVSKGKENELKQYYDSDGTFKYNEDILGFFRIFSPFFVVEDVNFYENDTLHFVQDFIGLLVKANCEKNSRYNAVAFFKSILKIECLVLEKTIDQIKAKMTAQCKEIGQQVNQTCAKLPLIADSVDVYVVGIRPTKESEIFNGHQCDLNSLASKLMSFKKSLDSMKKYINAFDGEKAIQLIDLDVMFMNLSYVSQIYNLPTEVTLKCFGLMVQMNLSTLNKKGSSAVKYPEIVCTLANYFNVDGTLKSNADVDTFVTTLRNLCLLNKDVQRFIENGIATRNFDLVGQFVSSLEAANEEEKKKDDVIVARVEDVDYSSYLTELRKYYRNHRLVAVPKDKKAFFTLLENCGLDAALIKYIMGLVEAETQTVAPVVENVVSLEEQDRIEMRLEGAELDIYLWARSYLETLPNYSPVFYQITEAFKNLESTLDLMLSASDELEISYLEDEKNEILAYLASLDETREKTGFLFLESKDSTYFEQDMNRIDKGSRKRALSVLQNKVKKEFQSTFRPVHMQEKCSYTVYETNASGYSVFFTELQSGVYVILGVFPLGSGVQEAGNRVMANLDRIAYLENAVCDSNLNKKLWRNHENILLSLQTAAKISNSRVRERKDK